MPAIELKHNKRPVSIAGPFGRIFAIHEPALNTASCCIIMLSAGLISREGARRLYWRAAHEFRKHAGVLRVDLSGVGDAESESAGTHFDLHRLEEVNSAIDYATVELGYQKIVLLGLCAGARVAVKAAEQRKDVSAVVGWSMPVLTAGVNFPKSPLEPDDRSSDVTSKSELGRLLHFLKTLRFLQPSWWRLRMTATSKEPLSAHLKSIASSFVFILRGNRNNNSANKFVVSVNNYIKSGRGIFFVYGEFDSRPLTEFQSVFAGFPSDKSAQSYYVVEQGQHVFPTLASQYEVIEVTEDWMKRIFRSPVTG